MPTFDRAHRAIHSPADRSLQVWMSRSTIALICAAVAAPILLAWLQYLFFGLAPERSNNAIDAGLLPNPYGFPGWLRLTHFLNFFFLMLLARSGLSILADHPIYCRIFRTQE